MNVHGPPGLHPLNLLNFGFKADPDPTFDSNAEPFPAFQNNADPVPQPSVEVLFCPFFQYIQSSSIYFSRVQFCGSGLMYSGI